MLIRSLLAAAAVLCCGTALAVQPASDPHSGDVSGWIVQFADPPAALWRGAPPGSAKAHLVATSPAVTGGRFDVAAAKVQAYHAHLAAMQDRRLTAAAQLLGRVLVPVHRYRTALNGAAVQLTLEEARQLANLPGVRRVQRDRTVLAQTDGSVAWMGAPVLWNAPAGLGTQGEGLVIGIMDTGIKSTHPSFAAVGPVDGHVHANPRGQVYGLCLELPTACNDKLIGIYDFSGGMTAGGEDGDGHGTHVASTAAGNRVLLADGVEITGVAPHAALISYKVVREEGNTAQGLVSSVVAAVEQAIEDGVDVINLSLNIGQVDPYLCLGADCDGDGSATDVDDFGEAMLAAREAGVFLAKAAGNNGTNPETSLGNAPWMVTVAAIADPTESAHGDQLAAFSTRGPTHPGGMLVPAVSAPGVRILAADINGGAVAYSGTSMASPHVAGAAALLLARHPQWTPDDVASALVTTARPTVTLPDGSPATPLDMGGGVVDLAQAVRAGLSFRVSGAEHLDPPPGEAGSLSALNQPALLLDGCFRTCTVTRRVTDLVGGGTWKASVQAEPGVSVVVAPNEFTLAAGETRTLQFTVDAEPRAGEWTYGAVRLSPVQGSVAGEVADTVLPMAVYADPGLFPTEVVIETDAASGYRDVPITGTVPLPDLRVSTTGLAEVLVDQRTLTGDPTPNDPFDQIAEDNGTFLLQALVAAHSGPLLLRAAVNSTAEADMDLFVGRSVGGILGSAGGVLCASRSYDSNEFCELAIPDLDQARAYWILVQNWSASSPGAMDPVELQWQLAGDSPVSGAGVEATAPGQVSVHAPFSVRVAWRDLRLQPGGAATTAVLVGAEPDRLGLTARIPVTIRRSALPASTAQALSPGESVTLRLAPGAAEERLFLQVPANASSLTATSSGTGEVTLYAARSESTDGPAVPVAPGRSAAAAQSAQAGANDSIVVSGDALAPGRWYITPVNTDSAVADIEMTVSLAYDAPRPDPRFGAWYNPERAGAGGFLYQAGDAWAFIWYTFLQDGTPTWYLGAAPAPGAQQGSWTVPLLRYSWNGAAASATPVGEAMLSLRDETSMDFSWNLDGESGSERYVWIDGGGCPPAAVSDLTGSWYAPELSGYGFSINAYAAVETNAAYFYDAQGVARWAFGSLAPFGADTLVLSQYSGSGPLEPYVAPTTAEVGTFERRYDTAGSGEATLDVELVAPLSGGWTTTHAINKLTDGLGCQ